MLSLLILLTGTVVTILVKEGNCAAQIELENILKYLLQQQQQNLKTDEIFQEQLNSGDQSEEENSHFGSLKKQEMLKLIHLAQQDNDKKDESYSNEPVDLNINQKARNINSNRPLDNEHDSGDLVDEVLLQLFSQAGKKSSPWTKPKNRLDLPKNLLPNTLIPTNINDKGVEKSHDVGDLNDYSKIYIVLNPQAIKKSVNKNTLNDLVSNVLSLSSSSSQKLKRDRSKQQYYKEFPVKENLFARRKRDSSEGYVPKGSMEESYKPKRSRNDHGGGNAGRTAIPYIRHRGDIYERDH